MLRHSFVCLQADRPGDGCLGAAVDFAHGYGGWLSGLYVRKPAPPPYLPMADPLIPSFPSEQMMKAYDEEVKAHEARQDVIQTEAVRSFGEACRAAGVDGEMHVASGEPKDAIPENVRTADLVIVGRGQREDSTLGSVSGWLVRHLARPVMVVGDVPRALARIAVAYDGSLASERALSLAADIAAQWRDGRPGVELVHARQPGGPDAHLSLAEHYLTIYDVQHRTNLATGVAADAIVETAERIDADLLVMGAYGHTLLREVLLGSTTQAVIARWRRPLLLWR